MLVLVGWEIVCMGYASARTYIEKNASVFGAYLDAIRNSMLEPIGGLSGASLLEVHCRTLRGVVAIG